MNTTDPSVPATVLMSRRRLPAFCTAIAEIRLDAARAAPPAGWASLASLARSDAGYGRTITFVPMRARS